MWNMTFNLASETDVLQKVYPVKSTFVYVVFKALTKLIKKKHFVAV